MKIKRFNESISNPLEFSIDSAPIVWVFVDNNSGDDPIGFNKFFDAVDFYIHWVNELIKENDGGELFEPMTENGNRLFTAVSENPDWEKCEHYVSYYGLNIDLYEVPIIR